MPGYPRIVLSCGLLLMLVPFPGLAKQAPDTAATKAPAVETGRDGQHGFGQHDFDANIGTWTTRLKRLQRPLSGASTWVEYEGTSVVREVLGGRANLVELEVEGPAGRIEGLLLRLYNPESRQWSMHYANIANGILTPPLVGGFENGRGEFHARDTYEGRAILIRFVITRPGPDVWRFEQSFSDDGGRTWELNWIATDTRPPGFAPGGHAGVAAEEMSTDDAAVRSLWSALDASWNARDAERFSGLFAIDAGFEFVDRGERMEGRTSIRRHFAQRFPQFAPDIRHRTQVRETHGIGPGIRSVDGKVEILRDAADGGVEPAVLRTFAIFAVMQQAGDGWEIRMLRIYQLQQTGASSPPSG